MHLSQGSRKIVLVILLLAVCYGADWTDDNCSYWVAARWRAFQTANGPVRPISGGGFNDYTALLSGSQTKLTSTENAATPQAKESALASVFGQPLNEGSDGSDASTDANSDTSRANSRLQGAAGLSLARRQGGLSGSTASSFGMSMGQTGLSGMSGISEFGFPQ